MMDALRKAYFWFFLLLNMAVVILVIMEPVEEKITVGDLLSYALTPLGLIALFGFAYSRRILRQSFWVVVISIILINEVGMVVYDFISEFIAKYDDGGFNLIELKYPLLTFLLFVPYYIGVAKYAFTKRHWEIT